VVVAERRMPVGNLPADLTGFVGRGEELSLVRGLLSQSRLVTLTGVGGVGKSRLAVRVAQQLSRVFPEGTWLVELSSLHDAFLLPQAVGQALGLAEQASGDPVESLSKALAGRVTLVVVDNCEHLVPACQVLLSALLRAAPGLRVLATSREVLKIPGEQVCEVAPLPVPQAGGRIGDPMRPDVAEGFPGVALFARRAAEVQPGFQITAGNVDAVVAVCGLSEGVPLFLELAAAQLRSLSVEQLAGRLDDRFQLLTKRSSAVPPRHRSLRAAMEWSYALCSEAEKLLWARASVFAGQFDLEAAEGICAGEGLPCGGIFAALAGLIDKSILVCAQRGITRRYWMLDTLRAYGLERLRSGAGGQRDTDEAQLHRGHRDYYLALAERFSADWFGPRQVQWAQRMRGDLPELRAALSFCLTTPGEASAAVRFVGALDCFWYGCGTTREGRLWLERALAADLSPTLDRVRALIAYCRVLVASGLHAECTQPASECFELAVKLDEPGALAEAVAVRGLNLLYTGDLAAALLLLDEGVERAAAIPDAAFSQAIGLLSRGLAATAGNDPATASELLGQSIAVCRAAGDRWLLNFALAVSIPPALMLGDVAAATAYGREGLPGCAALGDTLGLTATLELLAWAAAASGDHHRAARLLGGAAQQAKLNGGNPTAVGESGAAHGQCEAEARAALGDHRFDAELRAGAQLTLDEILVDALGGGPTRSPTALPAGSGLPTLTKRELEIARLLAEGLTNKQIAHQLTIATRTAESHVEHILIKLGFTTRTQIASWVTAR
jgi:predicted ATPase/DNA-binding CsgD family transcriptional regulator